MILKPLFKTLLNDAGLWSKTLRVREKSKEVEFRWCQVKVPGKRASVLSCISVLPVPRRVGLIPVQVE
jgi:hypothetical protein